MTHLQIKDLHIKYDDFHAVKGVNLDISENELVSLLGPSGCGKTSILRAIAGFVEPSQGQIILDGVDITQVPARERDMGLIFQNYALWPHMSVSKNIGYGLKIRGVPKEAREERVKSLIKQVQLVGHEDKPPAQLSGGQQQRVALARALAVEPTVLLCDEPLSNLDFKLRVELRTEIREIAKNHGVSVVYVTHDQTEALAISDKIAVINEGIIVQNDSPDDIYNNPSSRFVGEFVGENNIFEGMISATEKGKLIISLPSDEKISAITTSTDVEIMQPVSMIVRQRNLRYTSQPGSQHLSVSINHMAYMGGYIQVEGQLGDGRNIVANINENILKLNEKSKGDKIYIEIPPESVLVFDDTGSRIY